MKLFKNKIDDFFKQNRSTELVELTDIDVSEDPVRPELDFSAFICRKKNLYSLKYENNIGAIVCVAYTNEVPTTVREMDYMSQVACQDNQCVKLRYDIPNLRKRGAGREIINKLYDFLKLKELKQKD